MADAMGGEKAREEDEAAAAAAATAPDATTEAYEKGSDAVGTVTMDDLIVVADNDDGGDEGDESEGKEGDNGSASNTWRPRACFEGVVLEVSNMRSTTRSSATVSFLLI